MIREIDLFFQSGASGLWLDGLLGVEPLLLQTGPGGMFVCMSVWGEGVSDVRDYS